MIDSASTNMTAPAAGRTGSHLAESEPSLAFDLEDQRCGQTAALGGKAAALSALRRAGFPAPPGFAVAPAALQAFMERDRLFEVAEGVLASADSADPQDLARRVSQVRRLVETAPIPEVVRAAVKEQYEGMGEGPVAVRLSARGAALWKPASPKPRRAFLNVEGLESVLEAVRACWATRFWPREFLKNEGLGAPSYGSNAAVVVQRMVSADASGRIFTADPLTGSPDDARVEAVLGLGAPLAAGQLRPDAYLVSKRGLEVSCQEVALQPWHLRAGSTDNGFWGGVVRWPVPPRLHRDRKLSDQCVREVACLGLAVEQRFGCPQVLEWALADGKLFIVDAALGQGR